MSQGYYHKYDVKRVDEGGNEDIVHEACDFFVLDLTHDVHAVKALRQYRDAMVGVNMDLARDLTDILGRYCNCIPGAQPSPDCPIHEAEPEWISLDPEPVPEDDPRVRNACLVADGAWFKSEDSTIHKIRLVVRTVIAHLDETRGIKR